MTEQILLQEQKTRVPWNKGLHGFQVAWNKCLTKETDKRVALYGEKISLIKKQSSPLTESMKHELEDLYINQHLSYDILMKKFGILRCSHRTAMMGKCHTIETKRKIGDAQRGRKGIPWDATRIMKYRKMLKERWANPDYKEEHLRIMREAAKVKPTKLELAFDTLCKKHRIPFMYVGDGRFFIHGFNPDFIHSEGQQIALELFGDYWHNPEKRKKVPPSMLEPNRKAIFKKYGWRLIVIWEHEFKELKSSPNNILNKIKELINQ